MPKTEHERDYYADLELPPTADVADIKKQFKKLALKYHPDRNPGKEAESNVKFQVIQAAHEFLTDPTEKAKYDASRARRPRYPAASGVKGNPWQNVSTQYPPPPTRAGMPKRAPTSAAHRYSTFASAGAPPSPKFPKEDPNSRYQAWEKMRPSTTPTPKGRTSQSTSGPSADRPNSQSNNVPGPQPMPRTRAARQKADASFGNRKAGFVPRSPLGDEPPVTSKNYFTTRQHTNIFNEAAAKSPTGRKESSRSTRRGPSPDSFLDPRQSTPYQTHGGEKTNPFDGANLSRTKSSKENTRRSNSSSPSLDQRQRSFSVPDTSEQGEDTSNAPFATPKKQQGNASGLGGRGKSTAHKTSESKDKPSVFTFNVDDDTFSPTSTGNRFGRNSEDNIHTRFAAGEHSSDYFQFSAGGPPTSEDGSPSKLRSQSGTRVGRRSPTKDKPRQKPMPFTGSASESTTEGQRPGFNAEGWTEKIGPHNFTPQRQSDSSISPTRPVRPVKKTKPVRLTKGTAGMVGEETSGEDRTRPGKPAETNNGGLDSPNAMDIDSPPVVLSGAAQPNDARNVPVEPSRPDWRPGNANGAATETRTSTTPSSRFPPQTRGSEDTDEFRASFADLKNVEPLAARSFGLDSFSDLKSSLPFETKASAKVSFETQKKRTAPRPKITFPQPPRAPIAPPALAITNLKPTPAAWNQYAKEFHGYMQAWMVFNGRFVDHFFARKKELEKTTSSKGWDWLDTRGDAGLEEYLSWLEQDKEVREKWTAACSDHEARVREFMVYKDKMKK